MKLQNKRIVLTRTLEQCQMMAAKLEAMAAIPIIFPCIQISPPDNLGPVEQAARDILGDRFDAIAFTSQNAVFALAPFLADGLGKTRTKIFAVGKTTAQAVCARLGVEAAVIPEHPNSESLVKSMGDCRGLNVLLPIGDIARRTLPDALKQQGANTTEVVCYRTTGASEGVQILPLLKERKIDVVTFASPSAARFFWERIGSVGTGAFVGIEIWCIGETTLSQVNKLGLSGIVKSDFFNEIATS